MTLMCVSHFVFPLTRLDSREWSAVLLTLAKSTINETLKIEADLICSSEALSAAPRASINTTGPL